jgi:hypothetical protein
MVDGTSKEGRPARGRHRWQHERGTQAGRGQLASSLGDWGVLFKFALINCNLLFLSTQWPLDPILFFKCSDATVAFKVCTPWAPLALPVEYNFFIRRVWLTYPYVA